MSRILWLGNPPFLGSGYGEQAGLFVPRLKALGHELAVACNAGIHGVTLDWNGLTCYPNDNDWGNSALGSYTEHHRAEHVIALCDAWVLKPHDWPESVPRVAVWAPVDHYPIPPAVLNVLQHDRIQPIAMSRNGESLMRQMGLEPLYVPHGVDRSVFYPRPDEKAAVRAEMGVPEDAFLVGMVAANSGNPYLPRKAFPQAFHAFSRFAAEHDDAWLYVHTRANPKMGGVLQLDRLATAAGCPPEKVRFPSDRAWRLGMNTQVVSNAYQAFDVLLSPSMGEGFGIPILEAQASGVPVIVSDHSAMSELCQAGWLVRGDPWWDEASAAFFVVPFIDGITAALEASYDARDDQELRAAASAFADGYEADHVTETYWRPTLEALAKPREVPPLNGALNRQQRRKLAKVGR